MNVVSIRSRITKLEEKARIDLADVRGLSDAELEARILDLEHHLAPLLAVVRQSYPEFAGSSDKAMLEAWADNPDHPAFAEWER